MPHRVELQRGNDPNVCPVKALEDFIFLRGRAVGPLFSTPVGMPYTAIFNSCRYAVHRYCGEGGPIIGPVLLWIGQQTVQVPQFQDRRSF